MSHPITGHRDGCCCSGCDTVPTDALARVTRYNEVLCRELARVTRDYDTLQREYRELEEAVAWLYDASANESADWWGGDEKCPAAALKRLHARRNTSPAPAGAAVAASAGPAHNPSPPAGAAELPGGHGPNKPLELRIEALERAVASLQNRVGPKRYR